MQYEIVTHSMNQVQIREELNFLVKRLAELGYERGEIFFGFAWGNEYYETVEWAYEKIAVNQIENKVKDVEDAAFGELGYDDFFIKVVDLPIEIHFCNDLDIHLLYDETNELTEYFYERWEKLGYSPNKLYKTSNGESSERMKK